MKLWNSVLLLTFLSFYKPLFAEELSAPDKITWLINDAPPFFIVRGKHQGQGICDVTLNHLKKALPHISHEELILPHTRIGKYMDEGQAACFPCMILRPEPTRRAAYSKPTVVYPPHVLVTGPEMRKKPSFAGKQSVSLQSLLNNDLLIFAQHGGRLFGPVLDTILTNNGDHSHRLILRNEGQSTTSVLRLLKIQRADYTIEYPAIVNYFNTTESEQLAQWNIQENQHQPVVGAVGCSSTAPDNFSDSALTFINLALDEIVHTTHYQQQVSQWFNSNTQYQNWYSELVLKTQNQVNF